MKGVYKDEKQTSINIKKMFKYSMKKGSLYQRLEEILITRMYRKTQSQSETARRLGLSQRTIRNKFKQYDLYRKLGIHNDYWARNKSPEYWEMRRRYGEE